MSRTDHTNFEWQDPWVAEVNAGALVGELRRELPVGHVLDGVEVDAIAKRVDCDDVLFELLDGSGRFACVHLTWKQEADTEWPYTLILPDKQSVCAHLAEDTEDYEG